MLSLLLALGLALCQNWTVQVCVACEHSFDWHPFCEDFDTYSNEDGYFVVDQSEIDGLDDKMREKLSANLFQNHDIVLNTSIKVFNSFTRMITATRSVMYTSTKDGVIPNPLCDLASGPIAKTQQRQQCSVCASVNNYHHLEYENACCIDFSAPFLYSPTTVLYRKDLFFKQGASILSLFLHKKFLGAIQAIIIWVMLYAFIIMFTNPAIFKDKVKRWGAQCTRQASISIWLAVVTFTTVGYGDYVANRRFSRIITIMYMFFSMVMCSYVVGVCLELVSEDGSKTYYGFEESSQISGRNICIPGYYYYIFEDIVKQSGGTTTFKESFEDCVLCLTEPDQPVCLGSVVAGVLYDYPVLVGLFRSKPELLGSLAVAELGVFPGCKDCVHELSFHWAIPDRRYLLDSLQLPSSIHDIILDEMTDFVESDDFSLMLPEFELQSSYEHINSLYLGNVRNTMVFDYVLLVESAILTFFCVIIFSIGGVRSDRVENDEDRVTINDLKIFDALELTTMQSDLKNRNLEYIDYDASSFCQSPKDESF